MVVKKADGSLEPFSEEKVIASIKRAGIPDNMHEKVLQHVTAKIYDGIPTSEVFHHIIEFLDTSLPFAKSKYTLKQAIMDLGPTGYPFEDYIAQLLQREKFNTVTRSFITGTCVTHEVDVVASKDNHKVMTEVKFHNSNGIKTDIQVVLYTKARFEDIAEKHGFTQSMVVTNTKATTDAITYAHCVGMQIMTWSYPEGSSLRELVEKYHLYPITSLTTLSTSQKQTLLENSVVLCQQLCADHSLIGMLHLSPEKEKQAMDEVHFLCNHPHQE